MEACVCVCVSERERKGVRARERNREREESIGKGRTVTDKKALLSVLAGAISSLVQGGNSSLYFLLSDSEEFGLGLV